MGNLRVHADSDPFGIMNFVAVRLLADKGAHWRGGSFVQGLGLQLAAASRYSYCNDLDRPRGRALPIETAWYVLSDSWACCTNEQSEQGSGHYHC